MVHGAKHSPSTWPQGGPSGDFGGSSCDTVFSSSNRCFHDQIGLQNQKLFCLTGFNHEDSHGNHDFSVATRDHLC